MRNIFKNKGLLSKPNGIKSFTFILILLGMAFVAPFMVGGNAMELLTASVDGVVEAPSEFGLSTKGWVNLALVFASVLLIFILIYLFDISKYASKQSGEDENTAYTVNAWLLLIFLIVGMGLVVWEFYVHGPSYVDVTSVHGVEERGMFMITLILTGIVFVITQVLLFGYSFLYRFNKNRKALYYAHNNKLEVIWTAIPAIVLTLLVLRGFAAFSEFTKVPEPGTEQIEVLAYQFGWSARYAGEDKKLGEYSFNYISGANPLGLAVESQVNSMLEVLDENIAENKLALDVLYTTKLNSLKEDLSKLDMDVNPDEYELVSKAIEAINNGETEDELRADTKRKVKQKQRVAAIDEDYSSEVNDDIITGEIHLVKDQAVTFKFRARDVIHSAYLPTFRMQMNVVPGMPTEFTMTPTVSTSEWKAKNGEEEEYYMYCNKICGSAHFNMKIKVVVDDTPAERDAWLAGQSKVNMPVAKKPVMEVVTDSTMNVVAVK
jgi:cytochrome c oxidase subunit 2